MFMERQSTEEIKTAQKAFEKLSSTGDPYETPFLESIEKKIIISEEYLTLSENLFNALCITAKEFGGDCLFLSTVEGFNYRSFEKSGLHWKLNLSEIDYGIYKDNDADYGMIVNSIYSPDGSWGIITSRDGFAVLGGKKDFVNVFLNNYRDNRIDYEIFIDVMQQNFIKFGIMTDWIPKLIYNIYGNEPPLDIKFTPNYEEREKKVEQSIRAAKETSEHWAEIDRRDRVARENWEKKNRGRSN